MGSSISLEYLYLVQCSIRKLPECIGIRTFRGVTDWGVDEKLRTECLKKEIEGLEVGKTEKKGGVFGNIISSWRPKFIGC